MTIVHKSVENLGNIMRYNRPFFGPDDQDNGAHVHISSWVPHPPMLELGGELNTAISQNNQDNGQLPKGTRHLCALLGVGLGAVLLIAPFFRYVVWLGDEGILLNGAARILDGQHIYRDFSAFLPPLTYWSTAAWLKLWGSSFESARGLAVFLMVGNTVLLFHLLCSLQSAQGLAVSFCLLWLVGTHGNWPVLSHHWFTTFWCLLGAVCAAYAGVKSQNATRVSRALWLCAGTCAACALLSTTHRGALMIVFVLIFSSTFSRSYFFWAFVGVRRTSLAF